LREADAVVNEELATHDLMRKISQVPVVLIPLPLDEPVVPYLTTQSVTTSHYSLSP
jgi:GMP synthase PP-ATPase subunit